MAGVAAALPNYRLSKFQPLMPPWVEREVIAGYLLDVGGAWRWLSGRESSRPRVPDGVRNLTPKDAERAAELKRTSPAELPLLRRDNNQPVIWVRTVPQLEEAVAKLMSESVVGLDTECTLTSRTLCLIQMASREATYLIDALALADLEPLSRILASTETTKLVHYAPFERQILSRHGLRLDAIRDTRDVSRRLRPDVKGHSLREVCAREFGLELDKLEQVSDWSRRPLTENQLTYAALDAEVLLRLHTHFEDVAQSPQRSADWTTTPPVQQILQELRHLRRNTEIGRLHPIRISRYEYRGDVGRHYTLNLQERGQAQEGSGEPAKHAVIRIITEFIDVLTADTTVPIGVASRKAAACTGASSSRYLKSVLRASGVHLSTSATSSDSEVKRPASTDDSWSTSTSRTEARVSRSAGRIKNSRRPVSS